MLVVVVDVVVEVVVEVLGSVVVDSVLDEVVVLGSEVDEIELDWVELESPSPLPAMTTTATIRPMMIARSAATR